MHKCLLTLISIWQEYTTTRNTNYIESKAAVDKVMIIRIWKEHPISTERYTAVSYELTMRDMILSLGRVIFYIDYKRSIKISFLTNVICFCFVKPSAYFHPVNFNF